MPVDAEEHQGAERGEELADNRDALAVHRIHERGEAESGLHGNDASREDEGLGEELGRKTDEYADERLTYRDEEPRQAHNLKGKLLQGKERHNGGSNCN